jgi:hypothetical protein
MTAISLGTPYITRAELALLQPLLPVASLTDDQQDSIILGASRAIDARVHTHFGTVIHTERHEWNKESLRAYPTFWPVIRIARMRLYVSNKMFAEIPPEQVFIANQEHYVQIVSPALIASFASPIFTLTMAIPVAETIYAAGGRGAPDSVPTFGSAEAGLFNTSPTTLTADVDGLATTLTLPVDDCSGFAVGDVIRLEVLGPGGLVGGGGIMYVPSALAGASELDEWMVVTAATPSVMGAGDTLTVAARGAYGTLVMPHKSGDVIYLLESSVPDDIKVAASMIVSNYVSQQLLLHDSMGGLSSATIGSYSATVAAAGGAGSLEIPPAADMILDRYRLIVAG